VTTNHFLSYPDAAQHQRWRVEAHSTLHGVVFVIFGSGPGGSVKPLVIVLALAVITIAPHAGAHAQTAAPATAVPPGTTQAPWTSTKPGNSGSYCGLGEYAVGFEVEVAPAGAGPCAECISRLRVICRRYGI
jgi:hypothetical protein